MRPKFTFQDSAHEGCGYSIFSGEPRTTSGASLLSNPTHLNDIFFSKPGAICGTSFAGPILGNSVRDIFLLSSKTQVQGITASRNIARMHNQLFFVYPIGDRAHEAMGSPVFITYSYLSVSSLALVGSPQPAFIRPRNNYSAPKPRKVFFRNDQFIHKEKTARKCKFACGSSGSLPKVKVSAVLAQPAGHKSASLN